MKRFLINSLHPLVMHSKINGEMPLEKILNDRSLTVPEAITCFSRENLAKYVALAFAGQSEGFLPAKFWSGEYGGKFFAEVYTDIPFAMAGLAKSPDGKGLKYDVQYRNRLVNVLIDMLDGCIGHQGTPDDGLRKIAQQLALAVAHIEDKEGRGKIQIEHELSRRLFTRDIKYDSAAHRSMINKISKIKAGLEAVDIFRPIIFNHAAELRSDKRYQGLSDGIHELYHL